MGKSEMEEEVQIYRGLSRFFRVRESEVYQAVTNGLLNLIQGGSDPVKLLQETLLLLCRNSMVKFIDLEDIEQDAVALGERRKKEGSRPSAQKEKNEKKQEQAEPNEFVLREEGSLAEMTVANLIVTRS